MNFKNCVLLFIGLFISTYGIAQEHKQFDSLELFSIDFLKDSTESNNIIEIRNEEGFSLIDFKFSNEIDSLWLAELTNSDLFPQIQESVLEIPYNTDEISVVDFQELSTETLKERLEELNKKTPFDISYNPVLESTIRSYLKRNKKAMERLMSLSQYYFPLFEKELDKYDVPLELKYLPIIESALNPRAKSRVGATGLWQFMFATGKMHGLQVNSYVDERMDPEKSTTAAAEYLSELYKIFGDWNLVLSSYNYGPGNVSRAIRRSGGITDYWHLRNFMPRETANYVPAFLATLYVFSYAEEHGFQPYQPEVAHFETDTVQIKKDIKLKHIAEIIGVDEDLLSFLNPSFKLKHIPVSEGKFTSIRLPIRQAGIFAANEKEIYQHAEELLAKEGQPRYELLQERINYRVQSGDYLGKIANKYGVSVQLIKNWNRLSSNNIRPGQNLVIYPKEPRVASSVAANSSSKNPSSGNEKYYTVKSGDSIWSISQKFKGVTVNQIKKWNGISGNYLKPGMKLKISEI